MSKEELIKHIEKVIEKAVLTPEERRILVGTHELLLDSGERL